MTTHKSKDGITEIKQKTTEYHKVSIKIHVTTLKNKSTDAVQFVLLSGIKYLTDVLTWSLPAKPFASVFSFVYYETGVANTYSTVQVITNSTLLI